MLVNIGVLVIMKNSNSNIRELIGTFNRVVAFSKMSKKSLTINECKIILKDVYNSLYISIHFYILFCVFAYFLYAFVYTS